MDALERRLDTLERQVLGRAHHTSITNPDIAVVPALTNLAKQCGNVAERRDRVGPLFCRTAELDSYLDPAFAEIHGGVAASVKLKLVLAREEKLRDVHAMLERVEKRQAVINGEGFQRVMELEPRLLELVGLYLRSEEEEGRELARETMELVESYNDILETVTKTFVRFDQILKVVEKNKL